MIYWKEINYVFLLHQVTCHTVSVSFTIDQHIVFKTTTRLVAVCVRGQSQNLKRVNHDQHIVLKTTT